MCLGYTHVLDVRREAWHQWVRLAFPTVYFVDLLEHVGWDLNDVDALVAAQPRCVRHHIVRDLVDVVGVDAQSTTVVWSEPDMLEFRADVPARHERPRSVVCV